MTHRPGQNNQSILHRNNYKEAFELVLNDPNEDDAIILVASVSTASAPEEDVTQLHLSAILPPPSVSMDRIIHLSNQT